MAITFQDVTQSVGIESTSEETYSVSWVDFNSDGRPDLWISPHGYGTGANNLPKLYLSQGNGTFTNITSQVWPVGVAGDSHGSSWADFDNDGDPDLFVTVGAQRGTGQGRKKLFVNNNGQLQNQAATLGLEYPLGRGRSSLWFDYNKDGLLDILLVNDKRPDGLAPTALFQQTASGFENVSGRVGLQVLNSSRFAQLADLSGDGSLDLVVHGIAGYPQKVYDTTTLPFGDLTSSFRSDKSVKDVVIADFDGDLHSDLFLAKNKLSTRVSSLFQGSDKHLMLAQLVTNKEEEGVSFKTTGDVRFDFRSGATATSEAIPDRISTTEIFIGSEGRNPANISFSLSPNDSTAWGIKTHTPGSDKGLYIGYDPVSQTWQALSSSPQHQVLSLVIDTFEPLSKIARIGFGPLDLSQHDLKDVLLLHDSQSGHYVDRTLESGLGNPTIVQSAVSGDFDNDMDIDLYVARGYTTFNLPSVLYENQGNGTFVKAPDAGGAAGFNLGPHFPDTGSRLGVADYDVDGFLDLFVSNTVFNATQKTYLGSPHQLFRNQGNGNHWIELELEGVVSNRDGVGARVLATTGGKTQLREQGGGMHLFGQNQQQIHFGLGSNSLVDLQIQWPSGIVQEINGVFADQVLQVVEPVSGNGASSRNFLQSPSLDGFKRSFVSHEPLRGSNGDDIFIGRGGNNIFVSSPGSDPLLDGSSNNRLSLDRRDDTTKLTLETNNVGGDFVSFGALDRIDGLLKPEQSFISVTDLLTMQASELVSL